MREGAPSATMRALAGLLATVAVAALPPRAWWAYGVVALLVMAYDRRPRRARELAWRLLPAVILLLSAGVVAAWGAGAGAARTVALLVKSGTIVFVVAWLGQGLTAGELLQAGHDLRLPRTVRVLTYLGGRWAGELRRAGTQTLRAAAARGPARGVRRLWLVGCETRALMLRALGRADALALALVARGFTGDLPLLEPRRGRAGQGWWLAGWSLLLGVTVWLAWWR